jgi:hypothetical protein
LLDQISTFPLKKSTDVGCVKVPEIPISVTISLRKVPENPEKLIQVTENLERNKNLVLENDFPPSTSLVPETLSRRVKWMQLPVKVPEKIDRSGQLVVKSSKTIFFNR